MVWLTDERRVAFFQPGPLSEIVTIANLQHAVSRIWTYLSSGFVEWSCVVVLITTLRHHYNDFSSEIFPLAPAEGTRLPSELACAGEGCNRSHLKILTPTQMLQRSSIKLHKWKKVTHRQKYILRIVQKKLLKKYIAI